MTPAEIAELDQYLAAENMHMDFQLHLIRHLLENSSDDETVLNVAATLQEVVDLELDVLQLIMTAAVALVRLAKSGRNEMTQCGNKEPKPGSDLIAHPPHYTSHPSGIECIEITEHMGFTLGNAVKYLVRRDHKGTPIEDLHKARWYIDREIARRSTERWATWPIDSRYEISSAGRVRRADSGGIRKPVPIGAGYLTFGTMRDGKHFTHYVHRAVVETFFGVIPEGMHVCHNDGDPTNNHITNLRIDTAKLDSFDVEQIRQRTDTETSLAAEFGVSRATIGRIRRGEAWIDRRHDYDLAFEEYLQHEPEGDVRSALEFIWKDDAIEDLKKARRYINREITKREKAA